MAKKFKPHPEANNAYIPMYQDYVNSLEVHHLEYDKVNNDFRHPYFINYKKQKNGNKTKKTINMVVTFIR